MLRTLQACQALLRLSSSTTLVFRQNIARPIISTVLKSRVTTQASAGTLAADMARDKEKGKVSYQLKTPKGYPLPNPSTPSEAHKLTPEPRTVSHLNGHTCSLLRASRGWQGHGPAGQDFLYYHRGQALHSPLTCKALTREKIFKRHGGVTIDT